jgi:hypothetical protein
MKRTNNGTRTRSPGLPSARTIIKNGESQRPSPSPANQLAACLSPPNICSVRLAYQPPASGTFLRTNQPPVISLQYFSLGTNQHQPPAKVTVCSLHSDAFRSRKSRTHIVHEHAHANRPRAVPLSGIWPYGQVVFLACSPAHPVRPSARHLNLHGCVRGRGGRPRRDARYNGAGGPCM